MNIEQLSLRDALKAWRFRKGLTQLSVARLVGIDVSTYSAWESGRKSVPDKWRNRVRQMVYRS